MSFFTSTTPDVWTSGRKLRPHERLAVRWPYTSLHSDPQRDTGVRHYFVLLLVVASLAAIAYQLPLTGMAGVIHALIIALVVMIALITPFILHGIAVDTVESLQCKPRIRFAAMQDTPGFALCRAYRRWIEMETNKHALSAVHESHLNAWLEKQWRDDAVYLLDLESVEPLELSKAADIKLRASMDAVVSFYDLSHLPGHEAFMEVFEDSIKELRRDLEQALIADSKRYEHEADLSAARLRAARRRLEALRTSASVV